MLHYKKPREIGSEFAFSLEILKSKDSIEFNKYLNLKENKYILFNSGRSALKFYLKEIYHKKHKRGIFLLPSYLCGSIIQPFNELKIPFHFYKINKNLEIDHQFLKRLITDSVGGILFIHYFGFPQDKIILKFLDSLKSFGIDIIEDITHSILNTEPGVYGDYIFSSLRKIFPIPDGGFLKSNQGTLQNFELKQGYDATWGNRLVGFLYKDKYLKGKLSDKNKFLALFKNAEDILDTREIEILSITRFSKLLLNKFNPTRIAKQRRQNFNFLLKQLRKSNQVALLYKNLDEKICPLGFPILTDERDSLKAKLIENNIFPPIHWELPGNIDKEEFSESWELSNQILTIPCDQRYTLADMQYVVDVINK